MKKAFKFFAGYVFALLFAAAAVAHEHGKMAAIQVEVPWVRAVTMSGMNTAAYMTLQNAGKKTDRLLAARAPGFAVIEIHETTEEDGVMKMRELAEGIEVPAGASVSLVPGGRHIMLIGAEDRIEAGETLPLTLIFETAGEVALTLPVKALTETGHSHHHH